MDRNERESLDRHITGNYGADQEIEHPTYGDLADEMDARDELVEDYRQTVPGFDPADCSGAFDGFGVVSDADPGL